MQATTVREALRASLAGTFGTMLSVLPRLIVFAIALAIGWAISSLLARATIAVLRAVRFDEMARRSGLARFIENMGVQQDPASVVASASKWLVRLLTLVVALDVLGLPAGSGVLHQLLLWLPNLAVGLVALVIGGLAATALSRLVQGSATGAGLPNPRVLAAATNIAVWAFAVVVAVSQLGVATSVVNLALVGVVGGLALAAGLAFGWAARDRAAQLLSLLDERYPSPSDAAGSASPPEATAFTPPTASSSPPSPVAVPSISASAPDTTSSTSAPAPDIDTAPPNRTDRGAAPVLEVSVPELDAATPEFGPATPELETAAPELDAATTDYEPHAPELDLATTDYEPAAPAFDGAPPAYEPAAPEFEGTAPTLHASAQELGLFPEDEPALEPARVVPFEESWTPRSGLDRRRIPRPGPDRRTRVG